MNLAEIQGCIDWKNYCDNRDTLPVTTDSDAIVLASLDENLICNQTQFAKVDNPCRNRAQPEDGSDMVMLEFKCPSDCKTIWPEPEAKDTEPEPTPAPKESKIFECKLGSIHWEEEEDADYAGIYPECGRFIIPIRDYFINCN